MAQTAFCFICIYKIVYIYQIEVWVWHCTTAMFEQNLKNIFIDESIIWNQKLFTFYIILTL